MIQQESGVNANHPHPLLLSPLGTTCPRIPYQDSLLGASKEPSRGLEGKEKKPLLCGSSQGSGTCRSQSATKNHFDWGGHGFPLLPTLSDLLSSFLLTLAPRPCHGHANLLFPAFKYFFLQIPGWTLTNTGNRCPELRWLRPDHFEGWDLKLSVGAVCLVHACKHPFQILTEHLHYPKRSGKN